VLTERDRESLIEQNTEKFRCQVSANQLSVNCSSDDTAQVVARASDILQANGLVVLHGLVAPELADRAAAELAEYVTDILVRLQDSTHFETEEILAQSDSHVVKGYQSLVDYPRPVLNLRRRESDKPDAGMVDIFNLQRMLHRFRHLRHCYASLSDQSIQRIVNAQVDGGVCHRQLNAYVNESVVKTRNAHIDTLAAC